MRAHLSSNNFGVLKSLDFSNGQKRSSLKSFSNTGNSWFSDPLNSELSPSIAISFADQNHIYTYSSTFQLTNSHDLMNFFLSNSQKIHQIKSNSDKSFMIKTLPK